MALRMASTRCWPQACSVTTTTLASRPRYKSAVQAGVPSALSWCVHSMPPGRASKSAREAAHITAACAAAMRVARSGAARVRRALSSSTRM